MNNSSLNEGKVCQNRSRAASSFGGMPPNIVAKMSYFSGFSLLSTYRDIFRLYSFSRIVLRLTRREKLGVSVRLVTASTIFLMSQARRRLFLPSFSKPLEASTKRMFSSTRVERFSTMTIVEMPVPKNTFSGKPMMASMWLNSTRFFLICCSEPPR